MVSNIHFQQIFFSKIERLDIFFKLHVSFIPKENEVLHVMFDDVQLHVSQLEKFCKVNGSVLADWQMSSEEL